MAKYRKKPIVVEATQWFKMGDHPVVIPLEGKLAEQMETAREHSVLTIEYGWCPTLEGGHIVTAGDWIITGVHGENYPCKPDIFEKTYEPVDQA